MHIRFAIWAAVSTAAQAAQEKTSIQEQINICRKTATQKSWVETAGPFVVPGISRTRWVNLRDAEIAIPQLHQMLNAAQASKYDLLILYDYNRLRDLLDPVSRTLAHYNVQIYSVSQPIEPSTADDYTPYTSDTQYMLQGLSQITSRAQMYDLRRKYRVAMPMRVTKRGLPAISIPYAYRKPPGHETDRNAIPEQNPALVPYVYTMRDMVLKGSSSHAIAAHLQQIGAPPPRSQTWYPDTVRNILSNPFYCGILRFGISKSMLDPRTGRRYRKYGIPESKIVTGRGKHIPLWDEETHHAILAEIKRRGINYKGRQNNQFTGLMKCGVCAASMWRQGNGKRGPHRLIWRCSTREPHAKISHIDAMDAVSISLQQQTQTIQTFRPAAVSPQKNGSNHDSQIIELKKQRTRLENAYQAGLISLESFAERVGKIDQQQNEIENAILNQVTRQRQRANWLKTITRQDITQSLATWLHESPPAETNHILHILIRRIIVHPDEKISIEYY